MNNYMDFTEALRFIYYSWRKDYMVLCIWLTHDTHFLELHYPTGSAHTKKNSYDISTPLFLYLFLPTYAELKGFCVYLLLNNSNI